MNSPLLFLGDIGGSEMILIVVVILIFFGANKIPELARGLGKGIREFKDASSEIRNEFERAGQQPQQPYNPNYPPQNSGYPAQPYTPQPDYAQQAAPYQPDASINSGYPVAPVTEYSAPGAVVLPPVAPVAHHDTPIPPTMDAEGVPGTQPRRPQTSTDV
ncbi:MAG: twin-arginine translocase TatA/TatE family subunit [Janthinobacterium lividum]